MANQPKGRAAKQLPLNNRQMMIAWLVGIGAVVFLGGLFTWFQYLHKGSYNVFWDMVDNNLNSYGVTRTVEQTNGNAFINQKVQLFLGAQNVARGRTVIRQPNQTGGTTTIISETVGTPTDNYARYVDIRTKQTNGSAATQPDISSIKNKWSREVLIRGVGQNQSVLAEGLFSSIPIADLTLPQRQELVTLMKEKNVYDVDYRGAKIVERAGKQAYEYKVKVNLKGYITALKKVDEFMGLKQLGAIDPEKYDETSTAELMIVSSINGRQLLEITYTTGRKETYSGRGARLGVEIPQADLTRPELEKQVQTLFGSRS